MIISWLRELADTVFELSDYFKMDRNSIITVAELLDFDRSLRPPVSLSLSRSVK